MAETILSVSLKDYKKGLDDLRASLLGLDDTSEQYKQIAEEIRQKQQKLNDVMNIGKKYANALEGSYDALVNEMSDLKKAWRATNDEAKRNELGKQIAKINSQLKDMDASIGNFQRNVGNYSSAFSGLFGQFGTQFQGVTGNIKNLTNGLGQLASQEGKVGAVASSVEGIGKMALKASPYIAGVVVTLTELNNMANQGIESNDDLKDRYEQAQAPLLAIESVWKDICNVVGEVKVAIVEGISNGIQSVMNLLGIADDKLRAQNEIIERTNELENEQIQNIEKMSQLDIDIAKQQVIISDRENYTIKQRKEALKEEHRLQEQKLKLKLAEEEEELSILELKMAQNKNSKEENKKLAEMRANVNKTKASLEALGVSYNNTLKRLNKEQTRMNNNAQKANTQRANELKTLAGLQKKLNSLKADEADNDSDEQLTLQKKAREDELKAEITGYNTSIKNKKRRDEAIKLATQIANKDIEKLELEHQNNVNNARIKGLNTQLQTLEQGSKEYLELQATIRTAETNAINRKNYKNDDDYNNALYTAQNAEAEAYKQLQSKIDSDQIESLQLIRDGFAEGSQEYIKANINVMQKEYDTMERQDGESMDAWKDRRLQKMNEIKAEQDNLLDTIISDGELALSNRLNGAVDNGGMSEIKAEMELAKYELDNIYQKDGESYESYLARKHDAENKYKKLHDEWIKEQVDTYTKMADSIGNIFGTVGDILQENIEQKLEQGEITQEEAEKEFESVKALQTAEAIITTLSSALQAQLSVWQSSLPLPAKIAMSAVLGAETLVTGFAQVQKIQNTELGSSSSSSSSSSSGSGSGIMSASVSPLLDETLDSQSLSEITADNTGNSGDNKVYILQSDIEDSNRQVEVRQTNTSF